MTLFNQFTISISLIALTVSLIVGIILVSVNLSKINKNIKRQNEIMKQTQRSFLTFAMSKNDLIIKNTGKISAVIDSLSINDKKITKLFGIQINPKQIQQIKIEEVNTIIVKYHDGNGAYQETLKI